VFADENVGILLFDDVELATFADAVALFCADDDLNTGRSRPLFRPLLIAQSKRPVTCRGGFQLQPQATIRDHPPLDLLLIPGARGSGWDWPTSRVVDHIDILLRPDGIGVRRERHNADLIDWLRDQSLRVEVVIGICSGAVLLAACGLLKRCRATTHPRLCSWMHDFYPDVVLTPEKTLVDAGHVITARGWKGPFQAALRVISRTYGFSAALNAASSFDPGNTWVLPNSMVHFSESAGIDRPSGE